MEWIRNDMNKIAIEKAKRMEELGFSASQKLEVGENHVEFNLDITPVQWEDENGKVKYIMKLTNGKSLFVAKFLYEQMLPHLLQSNKLTIVRVGTGIET